MRHAACAVLLASGCSFLGVVRPSPATPGHPPTCTPSYASVFADLGLIATGALILAVTPCHDGCDPVVGVGALVLGAGGITSAAYGTYFIHECRVDGGVAPVAVAPPPRPRVPHVDPPAPDAQLVEAVPAQNPLAAQLTRQAHNAAVHGHCGGVVDAGERVHDLDATYHAKVFVADHAIAWCLQESQ